MRSLLRYLRYVIATGPWADEGIVTPANITHHATSHATKRAAEPEIPDHVGLRLKEPRELGWRPKS